MSTSTAPALPTTNGHTVSWAQCGNKFIVEGTFYEFAPKDWIYLPMSGSVGMAIYVEERRDDWSVYLTAVAGGVEYAVDLFRGKVSVNGADVYDVLGAGTASAVVYSRLTSVVSEHCLSYDGAKLGMTSGAKAPTTIDSWLIENGELGTPTCRIRTAVDCVHSAAYLSADAGGSVTVQTEEAAITTWTRSSTGDLHLMIDGSDLYLRADRGGGLSVSTATQAELQSDKTLAWRIDRGTADRAGWRRGQGQGGWAMCAHCGGLFWPGAPGRCPEGANLARAHQAGSARFVLPMSDPYAGGDPAWRRCMTCSVLYHAPIERNHLEKQDENGFRYQPALAVGACVNGLAHIPAPGSSYTIADSTDQISHVDGVTETTNADWRRCQDCRVAMWASSESHCAATGKPHRLESSPLVLREWLKHSPMQHTLLPSTAAPYPTFSGAQQAAFEAVYAQLRTQKPALIEQVDRNGGLRVSYPVLDESQLGELDAALPRADDAPPSGIDAQAWKQVITQLAAELGAAGLAAGYFARLTDQFRDIFIEEGWVTDQVNAAIQSVRPAQPPTVEWMDFAFSIITAILGVIPVLGHDIGKVAEIARAVVEIVEASITVGLESEDELDGRDPLYVVENDEYKVLRKRFDQQLESIDTVKTTVIGDWGRLQALQQLDLLEDTAAATQTKQAYQKAYRIRLFQQLMPLKFFLHYGCENGPVDWGDGQYKDISKEALAAGELKDFDGVMAWNLDTRVVTFLRKRDDTDFWTKVWDSGPGRREELCPTESYMETLGEVEDGSAPLNLDALLMGVAGWEVLEREPAMCWVQAPGTEWLLVGQAHAVGPIK